MSTEKFEIQLVDKIDPDIYKKLDSIGRSAVGAHKAVSRLQKVLNKLNVGGLDRVLSSTTRLNRSLVDQQQALSRLEAEKKKNAILAKRLEILEQRLAAATMRAAIAHVRLTQAMQRNTQAARTQGNVVTRLLSQFRTLTVGIALVTGSFVGLATAGDSIILLENKLKTVTSTVGELNTLTAELFQVAKNSRTDVNATTKAFVRFDRAMEKLGASQKESLRLTETINKSILLSGATTNETASGLLQLSQAFNKGKLDGDEFRTVMELLPDAADAIAKELKVTRGELLKLAPEGKITAEVMRRAFANLAGEIDEKFAKSTLSVGQALINLKTTALEAFANFEKNSGLVRSFAKAIQFLSDNFDTVLKVLQTIALSAAPFVIIGVLGKIKAAVVALTAVMMANPIIAIATAFTAASAALYTFRNDITLTEDGLITLEDLFVGTFDYIGDVVSVAVDFMVDTWKDFWKMLKTVSVIGSSTVFDILKTGFGSFGRILKIVANKNISVIVGMINSIGAIIEGQSGGIKDFFGRIFNFNVQLIQDGLNLLLRALNKATSLMNKLAVKAGREPIFEPFEMIDIQSWKMEIDKNSKSVVDIVKDEFTKAFERDFVSEIGDSVSSKFTAITDDIFERMKKASEKRRAIQKRDLDPLRGAGVAEKTTKPLSEYDKWLKKLTESSQKAAVRLGFLKKAISEKAISDTMAANKIREYTLAYNEMKFAMGDVSYFDVIETSLLKMVSGFKNGFSELSIVMKDFLSTMVDGFADSIGRALIYGDDLVESLKRVVSQGLSALISGLIKLGIQQVIAASLSKSLLASTTAASVVAANAVTAAWTPAAFMVGAATGGTVTTAGASSVTGVLTMAELAQAQLAASSFSGLAGFEKGGYTGDLGRKDVAGVVHGKEFVVNAEATAKHRAILERMNRSSSTPSVQSSVGMGGDLKVTVNNYGSSEITASRVSADEVVIIAREVAKDAVNNMTGEVVASEIYNSSSKISQAISRSSDYRRRRV